MAGLLDMFGSMSPEQTQGLLAMAAQVAQASNNIKGAPNTAAALAEGGLAYQKQMDKQRLLKLEEERYKQATRLQEFTIKDKESDYARQERERQEEEKARQILMARAKQGGLSGQVPSPMAPTPPGQAGQAAPAASLMPTMESKMQEAQEFMAAGLVSHAQKAYAEAMKLQPEYSQDAKVATGTDGKPFMYVMDKHGNPKVLPNMLPREKMETLNLGGTEQVINPYDLTPGQSFTRTMTADGRAADARARAANQLKREELAAGGKPQFSAELGGFISRPTKDAPNGTFTPLAGHTKGPKMTEDQAKATGWLVQAENGWKNMKAVAFTSDGRISDAAKPGRLEAAAGALPFGIGNAGANMARSTNRQKFVQAASSTAEALLRAATGAGVNRDEAEQKVREITPVWGDDDETIRQKMDAMPLYIDSLKARAGNGAALAADVLKRNAKPAAKADGWSIQKVN